MTVNHKDGNKENNCVENLEILTYSENHLHAFKELKRKPSNLGVLNNKVSKTVYQYDINGILIAKYPSAREAERVSGINHKDISSCCNGKRKTAGGFIWKFKL